MKFRGGQLLAKALQEKGVSLRVVADLPIED